MKLALIATEVSKLSTCEVRWESLSYKQREVIWDIPDPSKKQQLLSDLDLLFVSRMVSHLRKNCRFGSVSKPAPDKNSCFVTVWGKNMQKLVGWQVLAPVLWTILVYTCWCYSRVWSLLFCTHCLIQSVSPKSYETKYNTKRQKCIQPGKWANMFVSNEGPGNDDEWMTDIDWLRLCRHLLSWILSPSVPLIRGITDEEEDLVACEA